MADLFANTPFVILILISIPLLLLLLRAIYEPFQLENTSAKLSMHRDMNHTSVNSDASKFEIVFFSDLHANISPVSDKKLLGAIFSSPADVILFGGDVTSRNANPQAGIKRLQKISQIAKTRNIPCYAVRGNHEVTVPADILAASGFQYLENESVIVKGKSGAAYLVTGLSDSGKENRRWPPVPAAPAGTDFPPDRRLLLVHNPEYVARKTGDAYGYQLSGHFHGGQIYMPFNIEYKLFRSESVALEGIRKGAFEKNGVVGYISRGVGCVLFPLRLFSKPEVTHITLSDS